MTGTEIIIRDRYRGCLQAGAMGDALGVDAIPKRCLKRLELQEVIETIAEDLLDCGGYKLSPDESMSTCPVR